MAEPQAAERRVLPSPEEVASEVAAMVVDRLGSAIGERGRASWVLAGGSTPSSVYRRLVAAWASALDWSQVVFFWGDERAVEPSDEASNYGAASRLLLEPLRVPASQIRRIQGELPLAEAVADYEAQIDAELEPNAAGGRLFDLTLLGIGSDGHTASLFRPLTEAEAARWVVASEAPSAPHRRITLTPRALERSREIAVVALGSAKADAVSRAVAGDPALPVSAITSRSRMPSWYLDGAAAAKIDHDEVER